MATAKGAMTAPVGRRRLTAEEFRDVIGHFASGVTVITAVNDGERFGTTASAVCSLSLEPPMVLICMNKSSSTGAAVAHSGAFAINILGEHQRTLAKHFASKMPDKFRHAEATVGVAGQPLLTDAVAQLECRVTEEVTGGTHTAFLAEVESASAQGGAPLAYFRGDFGRLEMPASHARTARTLELVEDALDARCAIELGVVDRTVGRLSGAALEPLRRATEAPGALRRSFHETLVALAGSSALLSAYDRLAPPGMMDDEGYRAEHRELLRAYDDGDAAAARAAVLRHHEHLKSVARMRRGSSEPEEERKR